VSRAATVAHRTGSSSSARMSSLAASSSWSCCERFSLISSSSSCIRVFSRPNWLMACGESEVRSNVAMAGRPHQHQLQCLLVLEPDFDILLGLRLRGEDEG